MFKPVGPRIKIKIKAAEQKSAGGILLATVNKGEDMEVGEVVELGHMAYQDLSNEIPWVKVGDKVLFQKYAGKIDPTDSDSLYRFLKDVDVIAVERVEGAV